MVERRVTQKKDAADKLKVEVDEIRELLQLEDDIKSCRTKLLWSELNEIDSEIAGTEADAVKLDEALVKSRESLGKLESAEQVDVGIEETRVVIDNMTREQEAICVELEDKRKAINSLQRVVNSCSKSLEDGQNKKQDYSKRLNGVRKEVTS